MRHDLIFHIVEKDTFKSSINDGEYTPESIEQEGFIHCSTGHQINDTANRIFGEAGPLFLLIIDTKRVDSEIKYEKDSQTGDKFPHIYGSLNVMAILDKIEIEPDNNGKFDLEFSSN